MSVISITSISDLLELSAGVYGKGTSSEYLEVVLANDIDFADYEQGYSWDGLTDTWYMYFDGQGHSIKNIYCQATSAWGFVKSLHGSISNLYLTNISVTGTSTAAGMADVLASGSFIYNCHISGVIDASSNAAGIVRRGNANTYIKNCSYNGTVKSRTQNAVAFFYDRDTSSSALQVFNCQFTGELISVSKACSCFGNGVAQVVNCEFRGKITAGGALYYLANGGIIINCLAVFSSDSSWASINTSGTAYNCYYDETALERTIQTKMTAATTAQMKSEQWMNAHYLACKAVGR